MVLYRSRNVRTRSTKIIVDISFYCISLYVVRVHKIYFLLFILLSFSTPVLYCKWFYFVPRAAFEVSLWFAFSKIIELR